MFFYFNAFLHQNCVFADGKKFFFFNKNYN